MTPLKTALGRLVRRLAMAVLLLGSSVTLMGQMDLRQAAGVPLPAAELPAGTVSVRVVRESFANNIANQAVVFVINGAERTVVTDNSGRAQVENLPAGTRVRASAIVAGERL